MNQRTYTPTQSTDEAIYKRYKDNPPDEMKAFIKWYESGKTPPDGSRINWRRKLRDKIRDRLRSGHSYEDIHAKIKDDMSLKSVKEHLRKDTVSDATARNAYYKLKG